MNTVVCHRWHPSKPIKGSQCYLKEETIETKKNSCLVRVCSRNGFEHQLSQSNLVKTNIQTTY